MYQNLDYAQLGHFLPSIHQDDFCVSGSYCCYILVGHSHGCRHAQWLMSECFCLIDSIRFRLIMKIPLRFWWVMIQVPWRRGTIK